MNIQLIPPPDHDVRPATRDRQRDELIAIIDHESAQEAPRRRLVPLAAAAAVVAVTAGLAIGVPALRGDNAQSPVSGPNTGTAKPAVAPLSEAEKRAYTKACDSPKSPDPKAAERIYTVTDAFKWVNPPSDTHAIAWVVLRYTSAGRISASACGFNAKGQRTEYVWARSGETKRAVIDKTAAGGGTYAKSVARITMASGTGPTVEAIMRDGLFFAPMTYEPTRGPLKPDAAVPYTVRAYDANGQVVYASAKTVREQQAELDSCYTNPEGTKVVFALADGKGTPPVGQCKRGVAWNW
ncbi:hypothetical protein ACIBL3_22045 [Kribbella sp. NPDC050124]|uniref:hypothetical protein n=1 Tax=Kribbella sp. NPDC050124 TaxID=3364114 RepID=UPI0037A8B723